MFRDTIFGTFCQSSLHFVKYIWNSCGVSCTFGLIMSHCDETMLDYQKTYELETSEAWSSFSHVLFTAEEQIRRRIHSRQQCSLHLHGPQAVEWDWHCQLGRDGQLGEKVGKT